MVSIKGGRRRSFPVCVWLSAYNCQELFSQKNIKTYQRQEDVFQERFGCWYEISVWLVLFSWNKYTPLIFPRDKGKVYNKHYTQMGELYMKNSNIEL